MTDEELRRSRLADHIAEKYRGNKAAFCRATGINPTYLRRMYMRGGEARPFSGDMARMIERKAKLPKGYLDGMVASGQEVRQAPAAYAVTPDSPKTERLLALWDQLLPDLQEDALALLEKAVGDLQKARARFGHPVSDAKVEAHLPKAPKGVKQ